MEYLHLALTLNQFEGFLIGLKKRYYDYSAVAIEGFRATKMFNVHYVCMNELLLEKV